MSVLLIDDDEDDLVLCSELLREIPERSYDVAWAIDAKAAHAALAQGVFDVILLDHYLGPVTGLELLPELRERSGAPVVMLTGRGAYAIDEAAIRAGASDYLTKGTLTPEILERSIRHAIEREQTLQALRESEARFRTLVGSLHEGIVVQDREGRIVTANPSVSTLLGLPTESLVGRNTATLPLEFVREDGTPFPREERPIHAALRTGEAQSGVVVGVRRPDGTLVWLNVNTQPLVEAGDERAHGVLMSFVDITERMQSYRELAHRAFHDVLTGLPNRALFADRLEQALLQAERNPEMIGVAAIDLDRFKIVNDTLGHAAGDELLQQVAQRLRNGVREGDTVARLGGDEFTLLLRSLQGPEAARGVAQRVIDAFHEPFSVGGHELQATLSLGLALAPDDGSESAALLMAADRAAYRAKAVRGNTYVLFTEMHTDADEGSRGSVDS